MRFTDYIKTAFLNLKRQKLRTALTVISVVIGAIAVLSLVSLGSTVKSAFLQKVESIGALSQVTVTRQQGGGGGGGPFEENQELSDKDIIINDDMVDKIASIKGVKKVVKTIMPWDIQGIKANDKVYATRVTGIGLNADLKLTAGQFFKSETEHSIILSDTFVEDLGFKDAEDAIGKKAILVTAPGYTGEGTAMKPEDFMKLSEKENGDPRQSGIKSELPAKIVGVMESGPGNEGTNYIPLDWAHRTLIFKNVHYEGDKFGTGKGRLVEDVNDELQNKGFDSLIIEAENPNISSKIADIIKEKYGLQAFSMKDMLKQIFQLMTIIQSILGLIGGIALLVAMIGIINTMVMSMYERTREIGVMRACGATRKAIRRLFTFEAGVIGFLGGAIGVIFTYGLQFIGNYILNDVLSSEAAGISNIITIPLWLILGILIFTTSIGIIAGLGPAQRAARLDPVEALRYE